MDGFLLDTSICVFLFRGNRNILEHLNLIDKNKCYISEVTLAELIYGAENSNDVKYNMKLISDFLNDVKIVPFGACIRLFAKEKVRLKKNGTMIEDFDLLIGCTAVSNNLIMVTDNEKHFNRIKGVAIENWK